MAVALSQSSKGLQFGDARQPEIVEFNNADSSYVFPVAAAQKLLRLAILVAADASGTGGITRLVTLRASFHAA